MGLDRPPHGKTFVCAQAVIDERVVIDARIDVDGAGMVVRAGTSAELTEHPPAPLVRDLGHVLCVPGLVNAHSHAFQRAIRGATQRRGANDPSNFWSWRDAMYRCANALDPDDVYRIARVAFAEMARSGITCVGEFHYLHHHVDGRPYDDPNELSWRVVQAAKDVGIRIVLLDVYYARAGAGRDPLPEQRRFCDGSVAAYLRRVEALMDAGVAVGITPHSVRAVPREDLEALAAFANTHDLPLHIHVSEQPRENEECQAEHAMSPCRLLEAVGATARARGLTAVHAIHIDDDDRRVLGGHNACACPTTEADLGDGIVGAAALRATGTNLALGSDSNAVIDLVQEARLLEMHERLARQRRLALADADHDLGLVLLQAATRGGALALGRPEGTIAPGRSFDAVTFDLRDRFFSEVDPENRLRALFTAGTASPARQVIVGGNELDHD